MSQNWNPTHVQQHVPPQWQGKPGYRRQSTAANWKPPVIEQFTYPGKPQPERRTPPYPSHLMGFPVELIGFSGSRRGRGPSFFQVLYLGTHPIALLMSVFLIACGIAGWMFWLAAVIIMWLAWCAVFTVVWLLRVAVSPLTGWHRGRI